MYNILNINLKIETQDILYILYLVKNIYKINIKIM